MKDERLYLDQMVSAIDRIEQYTQQGRDVFWESPMAQDAVMRNFEIIGEAVKRLDMAVREAHPEIPWSALTGFRDVLSHRYDRIDLGEVWLTVERDLPELRPLLAALLAELDSAADEDE